MPVYHLLFHLYKCHNRFHKVTDILFNTTNVVLINKGVDCMAIEHFYTVQEVFDILTTNKLKELLQELLA